MDARGIEPYMVVMRNGLDDEIRSYTLPIDAPVLITDLVDELASLDDSREVAASAIGLVAAMAGGVAGYMGPYLEIRRLPIVKEIPEA